MKNLVLLSLVIACLGLAACQKEEQGNAMAPQACGYGIPSQYCVSYNPSMYNNPYGSYYTGNQYSWGQYQPYYYQNFAYGCPAGYQPMYTGNAWSGSGYTCVSVQFVGSYQYQYGRYPYYPSNWSWSSSYSGYGTAQACDVTVASCCGAQAACEPMWGGRYGVCVVR
jgi:hypothetical protein